MSQRLVRSRQDGSSLPVGFIGNEVCRHSGVSEFVGVRSLVGSSVVPCTNPLTRPVHRKRGVSVGPTDRVLRYGTTSSFPDYFTGNPVSPTGVSRAYDRVGLDRPTRSSSPETRCLWSVTSCRAPPLRLRVQATPFTGNAVWGHVSVESDVRSPPPVITGYRGGPEALGRRRSGGVRDTAHSPETWCRYRRAESVSRHPTALRTSRR